MHSGAFKKVKFSVLPKIKIVILLLLVVNVDMIYAMTFISILDCCAFKL